MGWVIRVGVPSSHRALVDGVHPEWNYARHNQVN